MESILTYKTLIDNTEKIGIKDILETIKHDKKISMIEKHKLLCYGYYKMDYFEDSLQHYRSIYLCYKNKIPGLGNIVPDVMFSLDDFIDGLLIGSGAVGEAAGGCGSGCCTILCCCLLCDCKDSEGKTWADDVAAESDCCLMKCLPCMQDIVVNLFACNIECCFLAPLSCCCGGV